MIVLEVKPGADEIARGAVACWDQDPRHGQIDERWKAPEDTADGKGLGGAHIVGDKKNPDVTYLVADTPGVQDAVRAGRLFIVNTITNWQQVVATEAPADEQTGGEAGDASEETDAPAGRRKR